MALEKIGIMGGSFNPIHLRHVEMGQAALSEFKLDKVLFLPTGNPPHKKTGLEDAEDRYEMTRLAVFYLENMEPCRMELDREGTIYTVDTLAIMKEEYPCATLYYIIGEDTMKDLPNWRSPEKVFTLCEFIVCCRSSNISPDSAVVDRLESMGAKLHFLSLPPKDVSSTTIRGQLQRGEEPEELAPQVMEYIRLMGLYGTEPLPGGRQYYHLLKQDLSQNRLVHSVLVAYTARKLAQIHVISPTVAETTGILHDCAKCLPLCTMQQITTDPAARNDKSVFENGNLLHAFAGAELAKTKYGVTDNAVINAIRCHTTGKAEMTPLDMIVYLADKIEPSRKPYPALEKVRTLAFHASLLEAMQASVSSHIDYVRKTHGFVHPSTLETNDWLSQLQL